MTDPSQRNWLDLPILSRVARPAPNVILRSAIFRAGGAGLGRLTISPKKPLLLAAMGSDQVKQLSGDTLDQGDLDVWLQLVHLAQAQNPGVDDSRVPVCFSTNEFLTAIARPTSGNNRKWLFESLTRLTAATFRIESNSRIYDGHLVDGNLVFGHADQREYQVSLNRELYRLFAAGNTTLDMERRNALGKDQLAQWLQAFYATHAVPRRLPVLTVLRLAGKDVSRNQARLRRQLESALPKVSDATGWLCSIDKDELNVIKHPKPRKEATLGEDEI